MIPISTHYQTYLPEKLEESTEKVLSRKRPLVYIDFFACKKPKVDDSLSNARDMDYTNFLTTMKSACAIQSFQERMDWLKNQLTLTGSSQWQKEFNVPHGNHGVRLSIRLEQQATRPFNYKFKILGNHQALVEIVFSSNGATGNISVLDGIPEQLPQVQSNQLFCLPFCDLFQIDQMSWNVPIVTQTEFMQALQDCGSHTSFSGRLEALLNKENFFIEIKDSKADGFKHWWQTWIEIPRENAPPIHLTLYFYKGAYDSNAVCRQDFEKIHPYQEPSYSYFRIYAEDKEDTKLELRFSNDGVSGEIIYIGAIEGLLSGNQFKALICNPLCDFANVDYLYAFDDAKISMPVSENSSTEVHLRCFKPIIEDDGSTWYKGFVPYTCSEVQGSGTNSPLISQDATYYFAAVEKLKQMDLRSLHRALSDRKTARRLVKLFLTYLQQDPQGASASSKELSQYTLRDLTKALSDAAKTGKSQKAIQDFARFYDLFFHSDINSTHPDAQVYNLALQAIRYTQVWVKPKDLSQTFNYSAFKDMPHDSFDTLVKPFMDRGIVSWMQIVGDLSNH